MFIEFRANPLLFTKLSWKIPAAIPVGDVPTDRFPGFVELARLYAALFELYGLVSATLFTISVLFDPLVVATEGLPVSGMPVPQLSLSPGIA